MKFFHFLTGDESSRIPPPAPEPEPGKSIIGHGVLIEPSPLVHGPSLFTEAQRVRLQELQMCVYKLRQQIYQASMTQRTDVGLWLSYVEMYHDEMNSIVEDAIDSPGE